MPTRLIRIAQMQRDAPARPSEHQPTIVSYDGGCAYRPRTRVPRRTPTGLSHAAGFIDQSTGQGWSEASCLSYQLGKLRAFGGGSGADLGERSGSGQAGLGCFHRGSPLFPARSGAVVVRG